ncbi:hypothetical protein STW0522RAO56_47640 [Raoultella planticola]|jgi:hypothetical protein|nr:hypothetical protein STW0522RAO56_47640 [Raoultella planticola]
MFNKCDFFVLHNFMSNKFCLLSLLFVHETWQRYRNKNNSDVLSLLIKEK